MLAIQLGCKESDPNGSTPTPKPTPCFDLSSYAAYPTVNPFPYDSTSDQTHSYAAGDPIPGEPLEPSGLVYVPAFDRILLAHDQGSIVVLTKDLNPAPDYYDAGGWADFEGVTYDPATRQVYAVEEYARIIRAFTYDSASGQFTLDDQWDVSGLIACPTNNTCLEGIAFVPSTGTSRGGYFYLAHQGTGEIFVVEVGLDNQALLRQTISAPEGVGSLQDLHYDPVGGYVYALGSGRLSVLDPTSGTYVLQFSAPSLGALEGFTFDDDCSMHFAQDSGSVVSFFR